MNKILKKGYGYSLIECLIVISCAGILVTIAAPHTQRMRQAWALWGGTTAIVYSLQWGRMHAVSSNTSMLFSVSEDGREYCWIDPENGERYADSKHSLPDTVRIESAPKRPLRFYQHGNAVPAGTYVIQGKAGSYSVIVSPGGRIRVSRN